LSLDFKRETDCLVIGSGIAGLWFSLKASEYGRVLIITKKERSESNTNYAQGGIAAAVGEGDSPELHYQDTLRTGAGLSHKELVRIMVEEAPRLIGELIDVGIEFSKSGKGFDLGREGGHSKRRIVHSKDFTGATIEKGLLYALRKKENVEIVENAIALDLIMRGDRCVGAYIIKEERIIPVIAKTTLLATGGIGQIYLHTTNPKIATGDGIAMAYRAGARIANMEFIQFHPTSLYGHKMDDRAFLISEAVRGEGGVLKTLDNKTFMERYDERGCLAPRDIVARAIDAELKRRGEDYALLDLSHLSPSKIKSRFPMIYETCLGLGIDITKEPIPVVPAAHYVCGGILTDSWAETSIKGLFASGECACTGVHGANRLASNSLLEALVFSERAALKAEKYLKESMPEMETEEERRPLKIEGGRGYIRRLKRIMWDYAGIVRSDEGLKKGEEELERLKSEAPEILELKNMITVAELVIRCAILRKESRGLHYNIDHPEKDDKRFKKDTIL